MTEEVSTTQEHIKKAADNIQNQIDENFEKESEVNTADFLTEEEEFIILQNKGIEYTIGEKKIYIKALPIGQLEKFSVLDSASEFKRIDAAVNLFSELFDIEPDYLRKHLYADEIEVITELLMYAVKNRKKLFEKKSVSVSVSRM